MSFLSLDDLQASLRFRYQIAKQPYAGNVFSTPLWNRNNLSWICGISCRLICVVQDVVLCFPGRWNWNRKLWRSQTWGFHDMFPHMFRLEDPCSMTCDIGLWKMRVSNALNMLLHSGCCQCMTIICWYLLVVKWTKFRNAKAAESRISRIYTILTLWYIMADPLV